MIEISNLLDSDDESNVEAVEMLNHYPKTEKNKLKTFKTKSMKKKLKKRKTKSKVQKSKSSDHVKLRNDCLSSFVMKQLDNLEKEQKKNFAEIRNHYKSELTKMVQEMLVLKNEWKKEKMSLMQKFKKEIKAKDMKIKKLEEKNIKA